MKEYLSLAKYFFGLCMLAAGTGLLYAHIETQRLVIVNKSQATQGVLAKAECAPNVFQEVRVMLPDGGVYSCGAIKELPVDREELAKWYRQEARNFLKAQGGK